MKNWDNSICQGSGDIVTGQASNSDIGKKIKEGKVGGLFNIKSGSQD
jgi:beta-glucosidase